jgi:biopolymer transport protein ExbD
MIESLQDLNAPKKARIEIIPLIDVVFFLLATFVLFTLALNKLAVLGAQLPSGGIEKKIDDTLLSIQVTGPGLFSWKEGTGGFPEQITDSELSSRLVEYKNRVPQPRVSVSGNRRVKLGAVVLLLDEVRRAHISEVALDTSATE